MARVIKTEDKYQVIIELTEEQYRSALTDMADVGEWIENAIHNKCRQCIDEIIERSGRGSRFTPPETKLQIIRNLISENSELLKTAQEKGLEMNITKSRISGVN